MKHERISFVVEGIARPKQSFRISSKGNFQPARVTAWQNMVSWEARKAILNRSYEAMPRFPLDLPVEVFINFYIPRKPDDRRRYDIDNYSKAVLDACNEIIWIDDTQVWHLDLRKYLDIVNPRIEVEISWQVSH